MLSKMRRKPDRSITLDGISKAFQLENDSITVTSDFSVTIRDGEFVSLFGPNGCGKSTILKMIAGMLKPDSGRVSGPGNLRVSFVFQNYEETLLPWRTCLDNIVFPLERGGVSKKDAYETAASLLADLELELPLDQYPYQCSGGQKQLTVLARSIISEPDVLLLDEPFAALDYSTRLSMEHKFLYMWERTKTTTVFVSHDIDEAIYLADRVLILTKKPSRIAYETAVDLSRPRTSQMLSGEYFQKTKSKLVQEFLEAQK